MRQISFWTFIAYYGTLYLLGVGLMVISNLFAHDSLAAVGSLIFPIAKNNSPLKIFWATTMVYWAFIFIWELLIMKAKLTDCPWDKGDQ